MPGEVMTLPAVGPVKRKALLLGGGAAAAVMGVLWWRKRHAAAAPAAIDPNADPNADFSSGMAGGGGALVGPSPSTVPAAPATNAQWYTLAVQALGFEDPSALSKALGLYLTGKAVTPEQELLIDEARAAAGDPPVAGPNGYPPAIRTQPSGGQTPPPPPPPPPPAPPPPPPPAPAPRPAPVSHVVVHGDTLSAIARSWGTTADAVYNRNAGDIEYQAHIHGHASSNHGWWIFPGTRLYKP